LDKIRLKRSLAKSKKNPRKDLERELSIKLKKVNIKVKKTAHLKSKKSVKKSTISHQGAPKKF
jgi:hypothetical protein